VNFYGCWVCEMLTKIAAKIPQVLFREPAMPAGAAAPVEAPVLASPVETGGEEVVAVEPVTEEQVVKVVRRPVLEEPAEVVAHTLIHNPGQWYIIARGERDRLKVISQTGYRIRRNQIGAFAEVVGDGSWETRVNSQTGRSEDEAVLLYGRWLPG
jgi:hypothetical protein